MKVQLDRGGERTIQGDGNNIKIGNDIDINDNVILKQTGHMQMEWSKIQPGESERNVGLLLQFGTGEWLEQPPAK